MDQEMLRQIISKVIHRVLSEVLTDELMQSLNRPGAILQTQVELTRPGQNNAELEPEKLVTEETVRQAWKAKAVLIINKGVICTPLARDAIKELCVQVIWR